MFFQNIFHQTECQIVMGGKFWAVEKVLKAKRKNIRDLADICSSFITFAVTLNYINHVG